MDDGDLAVSTRQEVEKRLLVDTKEIRVPRLVEDRKQGVIDIWQLVVISQTKAVCSPIAGKPGPEVLNSGAECPNQECPVVGSL